MNRYTGSLVGRVALRFSSKSDHAPSDLSAVVRTSGGQLVVAADELASLQVMAPGNNPLIYEQQHSHILNDQLGLSKDDEVDIEGLSWNDASTLFLVGSHSAKRKKPKGKDEALDLERLATVSVETSRFVLARLSLESESDNSVGNVAQLPASGEGSLVELLADDPHFGPFMPSDDGRLVVPGKDNGFDIEGICLLRERVLLGLRGPVLRGWAFVLECQLEEPSAGVLAISRGGKQRYRKHALDLDGLGVRELLVHGDDVLIMAGPTMALDGVHRVYRWFGGPAKRQDSVVKQEKGVLEPLFDVPHSPGSDRAEGVACHSWFAEDDSLLVLHDSPSSARRLDDLTVLGDVYAL